MEIPLPKEDKVTIYTKNNCIYCKKVINLLTDKNILFHTIHCDEFILNNKEHFLAFIKTLIGKEYKMFPMVFDNNKFVGGFNESLTYFTRIQEQILDFDTSF
jgi:glutaredoxin